MWHTDPDLVNSRDPEGGRVVGWQMQGGRCHGPWDIHEFLIFGNKYLLFKLKHNTRVDLSGGRTKE